ncbi:hypothetical protein FFH21_020955 [Pseudomonas sp. KBS0707]|nr:hypothetical protein FFH21_020955 [Pseudomonas sp. KBS0707]
MLDALRPLLNVRRGADL